MRDTSACPTSYAGRMYGPTHMRDYLRRRSETLHGLLTESATGGPPRVLEVACGPGLSLRDIAKLSNGLAPKIVGVDKSMAMLGLAAKNVQDAGTPPLLMRASAQQLPFVNESFDFVFATRFIHMVHQKEAVLNELRRVLRPQGLLAIEFYRRPYHVLRWLAQKQPNPLVSHGHHFPTLAEVRRLAGSDARFIPLRFGGERWLRTLMSDSAVRELLRHSWNGFLRVAIDEYLVVLKRA